MQTVSRWIFSREALTHTLLTTTLLLMVLCAYTVQWHIWWQRWHSARCQYAWRSSYSTFITAAPHNAFQRGSAVLPSSTLPGCSASTRRSHTTLTTTVNLSRLRRCRQPSTSTSKCLRRRRLLNPSGSAAPTPNRLHRRLQNSRIFRVLVCIEIVWNRRCCECSVALNDHRLRCRRATAARSSLTAARWRLYQRAVDDHESMARHRQRQW